ncbi:hypothetical protein GOP47_0022520 [Adiantum capillus-veneris]|uniref:Uncharacterized protein n=1 Tax=Adiantum capillus-veneris TaxID=13818 RepID=A0A9D4U7W2_ADICA|nr:hypothetical protein GOP47_0022520 [Adiantum capillus-veneris]
MWRRVACKEVLFRSRAGGQRGGLRLAPDVAEDLLPSREKVDESSISKKDAVAESFEDATKVKPHDDRSNRKQRAKVGRGGASLGGLKLIWRAMQAWTQVRSGDRSLDAQANGFEDVAWPAFIHQVESSKNPTYKIRNEPGISGYSLWKRREW